MSVKTRIASPMTSSPNASASAPVAPVSAAAPSDAAAIWKPIALSACARPTRDGTAIGCWADYIEGSLAGMLGGARAGFGHTAFRIDYPFGRSVGIPPDAFDICESRPRLGFSPRERLLGGVEARLGVPHQSLHAGRLLARFRKYRFGATQILTGGSRQLGLPRG